MVSTISIIPHIYSIILLGTIVLTVITPTDFSNLNWLHYMSLKKAKKKLKKFWKHCHLLLKVLYFLFFWYSLSTRPKICLPSSCHSNFSGKKAYHLSKKNAPTFLVFKCEKSLGLTPHTNKNKTHLLTTLPPICRLSIL